MNKRWGRRRSLGWLLPDRSALLSGAAGAVAGLALERFLGEPPATVHPVAIAGSALTRLEAVTYRDHRAAGVAHLAVALLATGALAAAADRRLGRLRATALSVALAAAPTMLGDSARLVAAALEQGDLDLARRWVGELVGRDTSALGSDGVARAVVESVAENTVDAATATVLWAAAAGPVGVWTHRVVNTLDAMIGHRNQRYQRFGWASARLDDAMNWIPARVTAVAVALTGPGPVGPTLAIVARDSGRHPSPNGGVAEAAFAGALGRSLGGVNRYRGVVEDRGRLGDGPPPGPETVEPSVALLHRSTWAVAAAALAGSVLLGRR